MSSSEISLLRLIDTINEPLSWSIDVFCRLVLSEMQALQVLPVTEIRHYKENDGLEHEFLIVGIKHEEKHHMLRIERSTPARVRRTFWQKLKQTSSSILPALDTVSISSSFKKLTINMNRGPITHVATLPILSSTVTLRDFCLLLSLFPSFSPIYKLKEEQCYWFCNVILATVLSLGDLTLTHGEGFNKAGKYGGFSVNMSAKACQLFIDGYKIVRRLQHKPDELGNIELTPDIAQTLVAMLTVQSDEAKAQALTTITSLASSSSDARQLLLNAGSIDQFRLIFISSSAKLKTLIFLALDALGLPDFDIFPDVDLIYEGRITTVGDSFTEEDMHALDLQYVQALRDVIDMCKDIGPPGRCWSPKALHMRSNCRLFISNTIPHMARSNSSEVRIICAMIISELTQCSFLQAFWPEKTTQYFPALLNDPSRDVRITSITCLRKLAGTVQYRKLCFTTFPLAAFLVLTDSDYMVSKIEALYSAGSVKSVGTAIVSQLSCITLDDLDEVGLIAVSVAAKYPVCYPIITDTWPQIIQFLTNRSSRLHCLAINILSDLLPISKFQLHVEKAIPKMFDLVRDGDRDIQQSAVRFLTKATSESSYHFLELFPRIVGLFTDQSWWCRKAAIGLLLDLSSRAEFRPRVEEVIPQVLCLFDDSDWIVQNTAVIFIKESLPYFYNHPAVIGAFPQLTRLLGKVNVCYIAASFICDCMDYVNLRPHIQNIIPEVKKLQSHNDCHSYVRELADIVMNKATEYGMV